VTSLPLDQRYLEVRGTRLLIVSRGAFIKRRFRYKAGEHLSMIAPSQDGKTTLAFQLLEHTARPSLSATVLVMKPRDAVPAAWTRHLGYVEVKSWPPPKKLPWKEKPSGYTLWPPHTFNVEADNERLSEEFKKALQDRYSKGDNIVFADEVYGMVAELDGLTPQLIAHWSRGSGMGAGLWTATQRPAGSQGHGVPGFMYSNATHLFFSKDPDAKSRQRYGEIGGVDPQLIAATVLKLRKYQFLYIHKGDERGGPYMCIIDAQ
jgi:hypothetical protein